MSGQQERNSRSYDGADAKSPEHDRVEEHLSIVAQTRIPARLRSGYAGDPNTRKEAKQRKQPWGGCDGYEHHHQGKEDNSQYGVTGAMR